MPHDESPRRSAPIACSLSASQLQERQRDFRQLATQALLRSERTAEGAVLVFRAVSAEVEPAVRELARQEKECCPFFDFTIEASAVTIRLAVSAPADARPFVDALLDTIAPAG